jgi:glutamate synthase domain-containing protein 2/glutamate synthase domain-containing protein 1/glutamate synthase domain-containing protein 3
VDHDACGVGFIAQLGSTGSRDVIERALTALGRLAHRGGVDADGLSGDGAGLLTPIPKEFFRECAHRVGIELPETFGLGMVFLPRAREAEARAAIEVFAELTGLRCVGWREVPTVPQILGPRAAEALPAIQQCFFSHEDHARDFDRLLFLLRKRVEAEGVAGTYFCSLSSETIVYKGLLAPLQLRVFYPDVDAPGFQAPFAVFHQRYSTNTQPTWTLAQPFRLIAHNGEINTIGANRRWMRAREKSLRRELSVKGKFRALEEGVSDSASFDNALEILLQRGYGIAGAMMRMVPPAWEKDASPSPQLRLSLEGEAHEQEPWDGPAALVFTDGRLVGAKLDRNGLRPLRYTLTADGLLIAGSEVGLADLRGKEIAERQRLGPGEMLVADPYTGVIYRGNEVVQLLETQKQDKRAKFVPAVRLAPTTSITIPRSREPKRLAGALGWTDDQFRLLFQPLGLEGKEATWSMGDDAPPAFLSTMRRPLWDYCKQRFAQVTNPPIDPLRESQVMSLDVYLGPELKADSPLLDAGQVEELVRLLQPSVARLDFTFVRVEGVSGGLAAIERLRKETREAAGRKPNLILLSDADAGEDRAALPAMIALSAVWKEMVRAGCCDVPVVVESGQAVETHHVALLIALGASAVVPYLAQELSEELKPGGAANYRAGVETGLCKVLARMGISTAASYRNSQLFEIVGLERELCAQFFEDAAAVVGGKSLAGLLEDLLDRHARAYADDGAALQDAGLYRFRQAGEQHSNSPELVRRMHRYIKSPTPEGYRAFAELVEEREAVALRDLLEIAPGKSVALDGVEDESAILSRFSTQAMSLGALGPEAHRTLAIAMNRLGARSNTGEGGEDPDVYRFEPEAANRVKQVASARFGVTTEYLVRADELEIKMAQGSKPGEGGQLPAAKVNAYIARLRHAVPGMSLISPPPHHDIYSIEDLAQLIYDLRAVNPAARIGVKLVSGAGVGIIAAGVAKAGADVITISGFDGGTGASPLTSIKNTGLPWEVGLREAHCALQRSGFRRRVRLRVDGGFKIGRDVIIAALLGADEFGFGTSALLAIGCVMARQCHLNTCPAGIATQDEKFRTRFAGNPEMVMAYFRGVAGEVRERLAALGASSLGEIVGRVERLRPRDEQAARHLGRLLEPERVTTDAGVADSPELPTANFGVQRELARAAERMMSPPARPLRFSIANSDRSVGAHLSGQILRRTVYLGMDDRTFDCEFRGAAGQSFGAFLVAGVRFRLIGEANDYVGKGLSGGTIAITAGTEASQRGDVLAGNTVLYGATSGELYIAGRAGERFAVRNSGALAVVEGMGQHGCEYMTAGIAIILGEAGQNFGSGMTGGLAYVVPDSFSDAGYNQEFVRCAQIEQQEEEWLRRALKEHLRLTDSPRARRLLRAAGPLPLMRVEPVHVPCPLAQTWAPALDRWEKREALSMRAVSTARIHETPAAEEPAR